MMKKAKGVSNSVVDKYCTIDEYEGCNIFLKVYICKPNLHTVYAD